MKVKLILVFLSAFILRIFLFSSAYHGDLNNNISWGKSAVERGLPDFYEGKSWAYSAPNQPPLSILSFATAAKVWTVVDENIWWLNTNFRIFPSSSIWFWEDKGMTLLVKLPPILADLAIAWLIYTYFRDKKKKNLGLMLSAVWLFNPITWYNSAIWGQTDSVVNFIGMVAVLALLKRRLILFSLFFTLSLLFKGSLAMFIPVVAIVAIKQKYEIIEWLKALVASVITVVVVSVWFHPKIDLFVWLANLYKDRILPGEIGFLTANAFNFWWLVDPGRILDSTIYFGLPARFWGIAITLGAIVFILAWLWKKINDKKVFFSLVLVTLLTFLFMTRIHERYMYPLFPYATLLLGLFSGMVIPYIILSLTYLLNMYHLFWAPIPVLTVLYENTAFAQMITIINLIVLVYFFRAARRVQ